MVPHPKEKTMEIDSEWFRDLARRPCPNWMWEVWATLIPADQHDGTYHRPQERCAGSRETGKDRRHTAVQKTHRYPRTMGKEMKGTGAPAKWEGQNLYITPTGATLETQVRVRVLNSKYMYKFTQRCLIQHLGHTIYRIKWQQGSGRQFRNIMSEAGGYNNKGWGEQWQFGKHLPHSWREHQSPSANYCHASIWTHWCKSSSCSRKAINPGF